MMNVTPIGSYVKGKDGFRLDRLRMTLILHVVATHPG